MGGRITHAAEQLRPDPKYGNKELARFINCIMRDGKRSVAERVVYDALTEIEKRSKGTPPLDVFKKALDNVRPEVEVRSRRVGGANYQVPMSVNRKRQQSLAFRWIIDAARSDKGKPMHMKLAKELMDASQNTGKAVTTRENTHKMADANRAFAHFAW
ncbi:MAG: 30S ribosomal protein S7 [Phycisphaerales bacterium]|nr:30S ribosomal protein S7 [Phycisphaerales bacterium]